MLTQLFFTLLALIAFSSPSFATAKDGCSGDCASCHTLTTQEATKMLATIGGNVKSVKQAPAKGLFELLMEKDGKQGIIFMDYGKKNLIQGAIFDIASLQPVSAHAQDFPQPKQVTSVNPATIPVKNAIIMGNPKADRKLYVFTDPDCPYCRTMHAELKKLEKIEPDIAINVMLFPLSMHPGAYDKARIILETKSKDMLDRAFEGKDVPKPKKDSSKAAVDEIIKFGNDNGISGTPTLVLPDGKILVGGMDAEALKKILLEGKM